MSLPRFLAAAALACFAHLAFAQGDADVDKMFKGRMGGSFGKDIVDVMPNAKRVAVPAFRVAFVTENHVSAQVRGVYLPGGIDHSGARSSFHLTLQGVTEPTLRAITDQAYAAFLKELAASGREVVPLSELKELFAGFQVSPQGMLKENGGQKVAFFSPSGMPLVFMLHDGPWGSGGFDLTNYRKLEEISVKTGAAVIAPVILVNFAKMRSSGNRSALTAGAAETGAELTMSVPYMQVFYTRGTEFRNGMQMGGDQGSFRLEAPILGGSDFGTMRETAHQDNAATKSAFDLLGKSMGMLNAGGAAQSSTTAVAVVNDQAYAAAANDVLQRMAASMGEWFRKHPPAQ
ncbi:MAG TPA: hypothetical protein VHA82_01735 [Ramlibacter sp.]|uniref:hypothetical protein n=1 Tax=Ramlibacter sp. TaxID=1917967 RepID=UPI002CD4C8BA|nr:hypothetical protein [Ramlibacter sp.]HVZ42503.1 hypothetical protein [Ramlibacter sp.]